MLTKAQLSTLLTMVGDHINDAGEWAQLSLACADQSGCSVTDQAAIRDQLDLPTPNCPYCPKEVPYLHTGGKLWHSGGVLCQDPGGQP